jgi:TrmH RNA methyltransferase
MNECLKVFVPMNSYECIHIAIEVLMVDKNRRFPTHQAIFTRPHDQPEQLVYGRRVCQAIIKARPQDIIRLHCDSAYAKTIGPLLSDLAKRKKVYHVEESTKLEKVSNSVHHEGIILIVKVPQQQNWRQELALSKPQLFMGLDFVENPHNIGAIIRCAANFGVKIIFSVNKKPISHWGSACRVAEGGSEFLQVIELSSWDEVVQMCLQYKVAIYKTSSHHAKNAHAPYDLKAKSLVIFGNEESGLSPLDHTHNLMIPGTKNVESLNVAASAAIIASHFWQQHGPL